MPLPKDAEDLRDQALRLAQFHENAKMIAYWLREAPRRYMRYDLIREIKKAQQDAYELGVAHGSAPPAKQTQVPQPDDPVAWLTLPSRTRDAFDRICGFEWVVLMQPISGARAPRNGPDWLCYWDCGESIAGTERYRFERRYSGATLRKLIEQGMLRRVDYAKGNAYLEVTERGWATFDLAIAHRKIEPLRE